MQDSYYEMHDWASHVRHEIKSISSRHSNDENVWEEHSESIWHSVPFVEAFEARDSRRKTRNRRGSKEILSYASFVSDDTSWVILFRLLFSRCKPKKTHLTFSPKLLSASEGGIYSLVLPNWSFSVLPQTLLPNWFDCICRLLRCWRKRSLWKIVSLTFYH